MILNGRSLSNLSVQQEIFYFDYLMFKLVIGYVFFNKSSFLIIPCWNYYINSCLFKNIIFEL